MEKIDEQLNNMPFVEVPAGLHQSIVRRLDYKKKLQPVLLVSFALLLFNFLIIFWHINVKLINAEFVDMVRDFFEVFNFNFSFVNTIFTSFFEIISPALFLSALLSLAGIIYIGKKITTYQFGGI